MDWNDNNFVFEKLTELSDLIEDAETYAEAYENQKLLESTIDDYLANTPEEIKHNADFLFALVNYSGRFFPLVPDDLLLDEGIIFGLLKSSPWSYYPNENFCNIVRPREYFDRIPNELLADEDFVLEALDLNPDIFEFISDELKHNEEVVRTALEIDICNIHFIPKDIHVDRDLVLSAVKRDGWNIECVPDEYSEDLDILIAAVSENPYSFSSAPNKFRNDVDLTIRVVLEYDVPYNEVEDSMWKEPKFLLEMVKKFGSEVLNYVDLDSEPFTNNIEFAKKLIEIIPTFYDKLPIELQNNPEIINLKDKINDSSFDERCKKTSVEFDIECRWDSFLNMLFEQKMCFIEDFKKLFFDTYWYFRNRKDSQVLDVKGLHILSSLSALVTVPMTFEPKCCELNEFNAARCLCEDLLLDINSGMKGYYEKTEFIILTKCDPPAGCSNMGAHMRNYSSFEDAFYTVVDEFDNYFDGWRYQSYSDSYNIK